KEAYSRRLVVAEQQQQAAVQHGASGSADASAAGPASSSGGVAGPASGSSAPSSLSASGSGGAGGSGPASGAGQGPTRPDTPQVSAPSAPANTGRMQTYSLFEHFQETFGEPDSPSYREAQTNFIESLAGYSIISYLLQIKDRHNGNILLDHQGHIIHIDFGFMLGISPGGVGFEAAPFKFPQEYIDILGGMGSEAYERFKALMRSGFRDVRKHAERIIMIVELMQKDSKLPCFALNETCAAQLRDRFQLGLSQTQCDEFVDRLVLTSAGSVYTRLYDRYQSFTQGIL
ncbi:Phosphatidylinositol 4-kinase pik1alpha (PI4-kinase)(PtdIns-4-kinase), partial [Tilletia horrida]